LGALTEFYVDRDAHVDAPGLPVSEKENKLGERDQTRSRINLPLDARFSPGPTGKDIILQACGPSTELGADDNMLVDEPGLPVSDKETQDTAPAKTPHAHSTIDARPLSSFDGKRAYHHKTDY
jgi:hypothetical protein